MTRWWHFEVGRVLGRRHLFDPGRTAAALCGTDLQLAVTGAEAGPFTAVDCMECFHAAQRLYPLGHPANLSVATGNRPS